MLLHSLPAFDDENSLILVEGRRFDVELFQQLFGVDLRRRARAALSRRALGIGSVRARRVAAASAKF